MNNERTRLTNEELESRKESLTRVVAAVQELIDNPELSMAECFRRNNLHYLNTRSLLIALDRADLSAKKLPVEFANEKTQYDTFILPEEALYVKVFGIDRKDRQKITLPEDCKDAINYVFEKNLNETERFVLSRRYGFVEGYPTLISIGQKLNLSRERVRQIEEKALRKLRVPSSTKILKYGLKNYLQAQELKKQEPEDDYMVKDWNRIVRMDMKDLPDSFLFRLSTDVLALSQRPENCFRRNKITTLFDAFALSKEELYGIPNLGARSFDEVITRLGEIANEYGTTYEEINHFCRRIASRYNLYLGYPERSVQFERQIRDEIMESHDPDIMATLTL